MMNAARPQTTLRDLEATPFAKQQIFYRHPHIGERHFCVTMRGMIIAIDGEEPLDLDARRIEVDQDHGLLPVNLCLRVGFAHQDRELAARIAGPRRPPFASVNDIMLAVAPNGRTNVGSVGRCRSEEHTSELQSLMRISYAVFCLKKKQNQKPIY